MTAVLILLPEVGRNGPVLHCPDLWQAIHAYKRAGFNWFSFSLLDKFGISRKLLIMLEGSFQQKERVFILCAQGLKESITLPCFASHVLKEWATRHPWPTSVPWCISEVHRITAFWATCSLVELNVSSLGFLDLYQDFLLLVPSCSMWLVKTILSIHFCIPDCCTCDICH